MLGMHCDSIEHDDPGPELMDGPVSMEKNYVSFPHRIRTGHLCQCPPAFGGVRTAGTAHPATDIPASYSGVIHEGLKQDGKNS